MAAGGSAAGDAQLEVCMLIEFCFRPTRCSDLPERILPPDITGTPPADEDRRAVREVVVHWLETCDLSNPAAPEIARSMPGGGSPAVVERFRL